MFILGCQASNILQQPVRCRALLHPCKRVDKKLSAWWSLIIHFWQVSSHPPDLAPPCATLVHMVDAAPANTRRHHRVISCVLRAYWINSLADGPSRVGYSGSGVLNCFMAFNSLSSQLGLMYLYMCNRRFVCVQSVICHLLHASIVSFVSLPKSSLSFDCSTYSL